MKLERVQIENYRAIEKMTLPLHPQLTVLHGDNAHGKTSVLSAIAVGLGTIPTLLPGVKAVNFLRTDLRGTLPVRLKMTTTGRIVWERTWVSGRHRVDAPMLQDHLNKIIDADESGAAARPLPIVAFYDTDRSVIDVPQWTRDFKREFPRRLGSGGRAFCSNELQGVFRMVLCNGERGVKRAKVSGKFRFPD